LLGTTRVTDLAVNVVLPWLWSRANEGRSLPVRKRIERRYFAWPPAEDNSVLRLARQRLLGGASPKLFSNAATQQGLLQVVRDFCDHSNSICDACKLPVVLRACCGLAADASCTGSSPPDAETPDSNPSGSMAQRFCRKQPCEL
jgi:hypothetical protein